MTGTLDTLHANQKSVIPAGAGVILSVSNGSTGFQFDQVNGDTAFVAASDLPALVTAILALPLVAVDPSTGDFTTVTIGQLVTLANANDGSVAPSALPRVTVLSTDADFVLRQSDGTLVAIAQSLVTGGNASGGGGAAAPVNSTLPVISGGPPQVGQALTTTNGVWSGSPTSYAYAWRRAGSTTVLATTPSYAPVAADVGSTLTVTVAATGAGGSASATSAATAVVAGASSGSLPAIVLNNPVFETASPIYGAKSFKGGSGTATIPVPVNGNGGSQATAAIRGSIRLAAGSRPAGTILTLTSPSGVAAQLAVSSSGALTGSVAGSGATGTGQNICDGTKHFFNLVVASAYGLYNYSTLYTDGAATTITNGANGTFDSGNATFSLSWANMLPGDVIDNIEITSMDNTGSVPTSAIIRTNSTLGLYDFDSGTGASS